MPIGAAIGGAVVTGAASIFGAKKTADAQKDAAKKASKQQEKQYQQARTDLAPYRETGNSALYSLADMYGLPTPSNPQGGQAFSESSLAAFRNSPDYQVAMKEGIGAFDKSAAANGMLLSGGQVREVTELGADIGSRYFGSYLDRLSSMARMGQSSAAGSADMSMAHGSNLAKTSMAAGEAKGAGIMGMTQGFNNMVGSLSNTVGTAFGGSKPVGDLSHVSHNTIY
jgi:hypothetical protein